MLDKHITISIGEDCRYIEAQAVLHKLADLVESNQEKFALYESLDAGKPITQALGEVMQASASLRQAAADAGALSSRHMSDGSYSAYERYVNPWVWLGQLLVGISL